LLWATFKGLPTWQKWRGGGGGLVTSGYFHCWAVLSKIQIYEWPFPVPTQFLKEANRNNLCLQWTPTGPRPEPVLLKPPLAWVTRLCSKPG